MSNAWNRAVRAPWPLRTSEIDDRGENLFGPDEKLGDDVELGLDRYERDVALVEAFLCQVPAGTIVVAYNGFGGQMPGSFDEVICDREIAQVLRMWRKRPAPP